MAGIAHGGVAIHADSQRNLGKGIMSTNDTSEQPRETDDVPVPATLRKSLKNRHIQLIALGGAIGTGLFYGSSEAIALAAPRFCLPTWSAASQSS